MTPRHAGLYLRGRTWWLWFRDPLHRIQRQSTGATDRAAAEERMAVVTSMVKEAIMPNNVSSRPVTFQTFATKYLERHAHQRGFRSKQVIVGRLVEEFGSLHLGEFSADLLSGFQTRLLAEPLRTTRGVASRSKSAATVNRHLAVVKHMLKMAVVWKDLRHDEPLRNCRLVEGLREDNVRVRTLTPQEKKRLYTELSKYAPYVVPIAKTMECTGLRPANVLGLQWSQVKLDKRRLVIPTSKSGKFLVKTINDDLLPYLLAIPRPINGDGYVFLRDGQPVRSIRKAFGNAAARAGLAGLTPRDLRHVFASDLAASGARIEQVRDALDHSSVRTTERYSHLCNSAVVDAVMHLGVVSAAEAVALG